MSKTHPSEFKSRTAFLEWMASRAETLAADLRRGAPPGTKRPEIDLRLQMATLLRCADFVLELSEANEGVEAPEPEALDLEYIALDIGHLRTEGYFEAPHESGMLVLGTPAVTLPFTSTQEDDDYVLRIEMGTGEQRVVVTTTQPSFGGKRFWFVCPGFERECGNRGMRLYRSIGGGPFGCHACHKAAHDTGWRSARDRQVLISTIQHTN
jgi:hypothetical protein